MGRVYVDRVRGRRDMRGVHCRVHTAPRVQEGRDGRQPDVLVRADRRHAAHVRKRGAVRGSRHRLPARRVLRQAVRHVLQLFRRVLGNAGPEHDDSRVRLRLQLHEPRERVPADVAVRVHVVRAVGAVSAVCGNTCHRTRVRLVSRVRQRQPVPGQPVVRRSVTVPVVRHVAVRVPLEAQLSGGRVLRGRRVPGAGYLAVLVHRVRGATAQMVRHVCDGRPDQYRDRDCGHRFHTAHLHDDVRYCSRADHQLAAVARLRTWRRWRRCQRHRCQLPVHAGPVRLGTCDAAQVPIVHVQGPVQPQLLLAGRIAGPLDAQEPAVDAGQRVRHAPLA